MKFTIGKGKRAQTWTVTGFWESGKPIDLSNAEDNRKLQDLQIKAMEAIGYKLEDDVAV